MAKLLKRAQKGCIVDKITPSLECTGLLVLALSLSVCSIDTLHFDLSSYSLFPPTTTTTTYLFLF
jgi:hypothetical protein